MGSQDITIITESTSTDEEQVTSKQEHQVHLLSRASPVSDSPSQSVSALPQDGSVEGEVQLLVSSFRGASHAFIVSQASSQARKTTSTEADNVTSKQEQQVPLPRSSPTSDSPSQWVSALPQDGSVEGEVQLLVSSFRGASHAFIVSQASSQARKTTSTEADNVTSKQEQQVPLPRSSPTSDSPSQWVSALPQDGSVEGEVQLLVSSFWGASHTCMSRLPHKHETQHRLKRTMSPASKSSKCHCHDPLPHQTARRNGYQHCRKTAQWKEKYNCLCHPSGEPVTRACQDFLTSTRTTPTHAERVTSKQEQQVPLPRSSPTSDSPSQWVSALPKDGSVEGEVQLLVSSFRGASRACMSRLPHKHEKQHRLKRTMSPASKSSKCHCHDPLPHQTARRNGYQHCRKTAQWKEKYVQLLVSSFRGASRACMSRLPYKHGKQHRLKRTMSPASKSSKCHCHDPLPHQTARRNGYQHCRKTAQWKEKYNCLCHPFGELVTRVCQDFLTSTKNDIDLRGRSHQQARAASANVTPPVAIGISTAA